MSAFPTHPRATRPSAVGGYLKKIVGSFYVGGRGELYQEMAVRKGPGKTVRLRFEMNGSKYQIWLSNADVLQIAEDIKAGNL